jgi:Zn-dependent protease with chaperone function
VVSRKKCSKIYEKLIETLHVSPPPNLVLEHSEFIFGTASLANKYAAPHDCNYIKVSLPALYHLSKGELTFLLGHELGHLLHKQHLKKSLYRLNAYDLQHYAAANFQAIENTTTLEALKQSEFVADYASLCAMRKLGYKCPERCIDNYFKKSCRVNCVPTQWIVEQQKHDYHPPVLERLNRLGIHPKWIRGLPWFLGINHCRESPEKFCTNKLM